MPEPKSRRTSTLASATGVLASAGAAVLWIVFAFWNPYASPELTGGTGVVVSAMLALAAVGVFASWLSQPYLMLVVFALSLFPIGLYMLMTTALFSWIGVLNVVYGLSAVRLLIPSQLRS